MLVEIANREAGLSYYFRAAITDKDHEDVRAMRLENDLKPRHAAELWRLIRDITPMDPNGILRPMANC
eukprot:4477965-Alexandrium_andersonii.AAC.1